MSPRVGILMIKHSINPNAAAVAVAVERLLIAFAKLHFHDEKHFRYFIFQFLGYEFNYQPVR